MTALDLPTLRDAIAKHPLRPADELIPGLLRKDAAVLVAVRTGETPSVILTARASALREHGGEVSFPGGKPLSPDEPLPVAALRESHEEIGLDPTRVTLVGPLSIVPTATSAYRLHPFVGAVDASPVPWTLSGEVERVLDIPLRALVRGEVAFCATMFPWKGAEHPMPFFEIDAGAVVYGATAYVLWELMIALAPAGFSLPEAQIVPTPAWTGPLVERFRALEARAARG